MVSVVSKGDEKFAEDLIKHGADVNAQNDANGMTPLQVAVTIGGMNEPFKDNISFPFLLFLGAMTFIFHLLGDENMVDMLTNNANTKVTYQNGKNIIFDAVASGNVQYMLIR